MIGPFNIETGSENPAIVMQRYEADPTLVARNAQLQDPDNPPSFLNCITRNFSVKRSALPASESLFDPLFGYSADARVRFWLGGCGDGLSAVPGGSLS